MFKFLSSKVSSLFSVVSVFAMSLFAPSVFAADTPPDFSLITGGVDASAVITGILAIGGVLAGIAAVIMGVRKILTIIR